LYADWFWTTGFLPDSLVQFLPESLGFTLTLHERVPSYSELARFTRENNGSLFRVEKHSHRKQPNISISGARSMGHTGLIAGDRVLARYEHGFVRARKIPVDDGIRIVNAKIYGRWLEDLGFLTGEVMTIDSEPGLITCTFIENGLERVEEIVKYARKKRMKLVRLKTSKDVSFTPMFEIPPSCLEKAGFSPDDTFHAVCEYGRIQLQKLDCRRYGF